MEKNNFVYNCLNNKELNRLNKICNRKKRKNKKSWLRRLIGDTVCKQVQNIKWDNWRN